MGHTPLVHLSQSGSTVMSRGLCYVLVGSDLCMTGRLKFGPVSIPNSCGHDTGGFLWALKSRSDDHSTAHGHVLRRVVSRLTRNSAFPSGFWFLGWIIKALQRERSLSSRAYPTVKTWGSYFSLWVLINFVGKESTKTNLNFLFSVINFLQL